MNLILRTLWFDDDDTGEFINSLDLEPYKEEVRSWGFGPEIRFVNTAEEFMGQQPFNDYDVIVVDYNLGDKLPHGEEFIKQVRQQGVYTETIFYSANPTGKLWEAIHEQKLEGVFVSDRRMVREKLTAVAYQSVRKVLDVNNMRGVVMAEVGDIDRILESILRAALSGLTTEQQLGVLKRFHERALEQGKKHSDKLQEFKAAPTVEGMLLFCDSYKRWLLFKSIMKIHPSLKGIQIGDFNQEVLSPRNYLAHGTGQMIDRGYVFRYLDREYLFNDDVSLALRKTILEYKKTFESIRTQLLPQ